MRYAGLIKDDFNNGTGIGLTLFTQYCPHHCKGCQNPETWSKTGGKEYTQEVHQEIINYFTNTPHATRMSMGLTLRRMAMNATMVMSTLTQKRRGSSAKVL